MNRAKWIEMIETSRNVLQATKKEIDEMYSQLSAVLENGGANDATNAEELSNQLTYYNTILRNMKKQAEHLTRQIQKDQMDPTNSAVVEHYRKIEKENRQIDEIIRPFLLPILLRSVFLPNGGNVE